MLFYLLFIFAANLELVFYPLPQFNLSNQEHIHNFLFNGLIQTDLRFT